MNCPTCAERRAAVLKAWQERKIAEAVRQAALGAGDMIRKAVDRGVARD